MKIDNNIIIKDYNSNVAANMTQSDRIAIIDSMSRIAGSEDLSTAMADYASKIGKYTHQIKELEDAKPQSDLVKSNIKEITKMRQTEVDGMTALLTGNQEVPEKGYLTTTLAQVLIGQLEASNDPDYMKFFLGDVSYTATW
ncbi:hypothetical protein [Pseudoalteromonas luteoviolacea]|uniref:Uncharacterized protein n=1 Tax=Pseudoalteromonas luteoviolacea S4054 TaxID=1129367 RepID=A0A0F6AE19_9GAMM|nr:hypothetical protein [Pseudoalteromonas luteoviolacea]AOT07994.1 hypothetical protein S4054249_09115 [Pseudoalteromonas luteoviolacea]AOT12910.1 hypothetical protein S40542_09115 [Pseudoalteromonas luteoviolacea]AOT17823.1 hypothetical protein S4054_09110 [Pseudoalteromonas luteoviolacea]KKE84457.1 hypothetical protein N479_09455 [Pseudoalteromonas luteoviolacea S4054]KZN71832.1 hypothetical protein N481_17995 [Pseudoalteromonas luteoviolacea S4047-1]